MSALVEDVPLAWQHATGTPKPWLVGGARAFGRTMFRSLLTLRVQGTELVPRTGPVLLAGNHSGYLDGPLVYAVSPRPATFLAKAELFATPVGRPLGWLAQVPVHRGRADRAALLAGLDTLRAGGVVGMFPEGTRGLGTLDTVADGAAWLALRAAAPVVPVAVHGTAVALPKGARAPVLRSPVSVVFGAPVHLHVDGDPHARSTVRAAGEQLRLLMLAHLRRTQGSGSPREDQPRTHVREDPHQPDVQDHHHDQHQDHDRDHDQQDHVQQHHDRAEIDPQHQQEKP